MVYQSGKDDCGKAVVRNMAVLVFGEDDFQILPLREACRDFLSIRRALQNIGIQCIPYAIESLDFVRKEQLPGIAQIKNENPIFQFMKYSHLKNVFDSSGLRAFVLALAGTTLLVTAATAGERYSKCRLNSHASVRNSPRGNAPSCASLPSFARTTAPSAVILETVLSRCTGTLFAAKKSRR